MYAQLAAERGRIWLSKAIDNFDASSEGYVNILCYALAMNTVLYCIFRSRDNREETDFDIYSEVLKVDKLFRIDPNRDQNNLLRYKFFFC